MRRCLIVDPGFATLGGGERYMFALGQLIGESHEVTYATSGPIPGADALARFGLPDVKISSLDPREVSMASVDYDLAVAMAVQLPPVLRAAHNIVVVQFPARPLPTHRFWKHWAVHHLRRYHRIVYSDFARRWLLARWNVDADILAPAVDIPAGAMPTKENLILSVGRFFAGGHCKRQDVLVEAFAHLPEQLRTSWHLTLAGGYQDSPESAAFLERVQRAAHGLNISLELNVSAARLAELQARARLFWHATGFERPADAPERAEHFGLSTVEAMSHGVIPLVFADGGQVEIVTPEAGFLWESIRELVDQSAALMTQSPAALESRARAARAASRSFSTDQFNADARRYLAQWTLQRPGPVAARKAIAIAERDGRRALLSLNRLNRRA